MFYCCSWGNRLGDKSTHSLHCAKAWLAASLKVSDETRVFQRLFAKLGFGHARFSAELPNVFYQGGYFGVLYGV